MKTLLTNDPSAAAAFIRQGGVVAFPTETVYGLGADVFDVAGIARIFAAKGRPQDNPLIAHISTQEHIELLASGISASATTLMEAFFPGPLTVVLPKHTDVPDIATAGLDTIGIRMPRHPLAQTFLRDCGSPVAAPSANLSGRPSPTTWQAVREDLDGRIDAILCGEQSEVGLESTVVDCTGSVPLILRVGAVTLEQLRTAVPTIRLASTDAPVRSPGQKHRHYSPRAIVELVADISSVQPTENSAYIGTSPVPPNFVLPLMYIARDQTDYAHSLFDFFRRCDQANITTIYCQTVDESGLGLALMDRMRRAGEK